MKIVFLCGSLEQGHDGVGDYTTKLAIELIRQGNHVSAISLNDSFITDVFQGEQNPECPAFKILRLPSALKSKERFSLAQHWIDQYDPDWISLQFVIYSYNPKGLPFGLGKLMATLGKDRKWHIMFHEIWIGISEASPLKDKIIGYFQKKIVLSLKKSVKPAVITTSNILYKLLLTSINIDSMILNLFSNIDIAPKNEVFINQVLNDLGVEGDADRANWKVFGVFGTIHPDVDLEGILKEQYLICGAENLKMAFIAFGRIGQHGQLEFKRLRKALPPAIKMLYSGEVNQDEASNLMQLLDVGISCTQLPYIGKSGVFAAMKLHGLEVIIPENKTIPEYDVEIKKALSGIINKDTDEWSVLSTANNLVNLMAAS